MRRAPDDRVCVIGAGPSGLAVCKELAGAGIPFDAFEANRSIGGIWDVEGSDRGGYRSLQTNTSKTKMAFSDFPFPESAPPFLHHSELLDYFQRYVDHFGFRDRIRLDCPVERALPIDDGRWGIELADGTRHEYAACIVATGQYGTRRWPETRSLGPFDGEQIHAADYLDPTTPLDCRGRRVVAVGLGSSAAEIATELAGGEDGEPIASQVVLSARSGRYILPKLFHGMPLDANAPHPATPLPRVLAWLPEAARTRLFRLAMQKAFGRLEQRVGRPSKWKLPDPTIDAWAERPTLSHGFIPALEAGRIDPRPAIEALDGRTLKFSDGSTAEADIILWATGYEPAFPFLDAATLGADAADLELYRRIVHPEHPTLFFVGFTRVICSLWPLSEQQARWLVGVLEGRVALPNAAGRARRAIRVAKALPVFCHAYADELRRDAR